jgi:hypothetical protein
VNHSPGPWKVIALYPRDIAAPDGKLLATAYPVNAEDPGPPATYHADSRFLIAEANARLMADERAQERNEELKP